MLITSLGPAAWSPAVAAPPPPAASGAAPSWARVPASPGVLYAPDLTADVFRFHRSYYYYYEGLWYRSGNLRGPWQEVARVPRAIIRINRAYFKSPPPW